MHSSIPPGLHIPAGDITFLTLPRGSLFPDIQCENKSSSPGGMRLLRQHRLQISILYYVKSV